MDRWLGDGGMPVIAAVGGEFTGYGDLWAEASWSPTAMACNPAGTVQAGVFAVLLDAAMNFAINASLDGGDRSRATLEMKTETMKAGRPGERYVVRGEVTRMSKQVAWTLGTVTDAEGTLLARSTATFLLHRATP